MHNKKIAHIMISEKFSAPFIDFVNTHHSQYKHHFYFITSEKYEHGLTPAHLPDFRHSDQDFINLERELNDFEQIILHGNWRDKICRIILNNPSILKKTFWVLWGGDYHHPEQYTPERIELIKKVPYLIAGSPQAIELVRTMYGAIGEHFTSFVYPSNIAVIESSNHNKDKSVIDVLICNCGAAYLEHKDLLLKLRELDRPDINYKAVLSYPKMNSYIEEVITMGHALYNHRFEAFTNFMPYDKYLALLSRIDLAIFNAKRQQATGNIIQLLARGCKVVMHSEVSTYQYLKKLGFAIYNSSEYALQPLSFEEKQQNRQLVNSLFSLEALKESLSSIFDFS